MVTVVATILFVALVVTMRKLDNKKTHLCLVNRDVFLYLIIFIDTPHFCGRSSYIFIIQEFIEKVK